MHSLSPIKKPTKQTKQRHKEVFALKKSNIILILPFQVLKTNTNTGISVITKPGRSKVWKSMSQKGEPGQQFPRFAVPSQPSGGVAADPDMVVSLATCLPPHPSAALILMVFFDLLSFWSKGRGESVLCSLKSQYLEHSFPKFPGEWSQI